MKRAPPEDGAPAMSRSNAAYARPVTVPNPAGR